jgi:tRNA threonylcarbamoyladenosine modification (KEOPS) complex  Pcc1 subunit
MSQVIIDEIVTRLHTVDGAISRETARALIEAVLPAVQEMFAHRGRIEDERRIDNSYLDRIEQGGREP